MSSEKPPRLSRRDLFRKARDLTLVTGGPKPDYNVTFALPYEAYERIMKQTLPADRNQAISESINLLSADQGDIGPTYDIWREGGNWTMESSEYAKLLTTDNKKIARNPNHFQTFSNDDLNNLIINVSKTFDAF